ncbi:uncharacterized protein LOC130818465 [Amaranthus tricolor]|uniref:uncharacterized protein LOC130818465 n=1 Tax=Amaranthus tricolor TaxID=29722 RepID=UPI00258C78C3|nr:uncharacterized protein LOC130818465 [Amaranthus tricolor]
MNCKWDVEQLARAYIKYVIRYHGIPRTIVSDRDTRYLSHFWKSLQQALGTTLLHSTSFHPMTDGQTKRVNQILEDMLRAVAKEWQGPYDIVEKVGKLAYRLALPNALGKVHDVFHISQLKRYVVASSHVLDSEALELDESLTYEEQPVRILDKKVRSTRRNDITMVMVLWSNHRSQEAT